MEKIITSSVAENGQLTRKEAEEMLGIGTTRAFKLLKELCDEKNLCSDGSGRSIRYVMLS